MRSWTPVASLITVAATWFSSRAMAAFSISRPSFTVKISRSGVPSVNSDYEWATADIIPPGFTKVCEQNGWDTPQMWARLNGRRCWLSSSTNDSYIYWNNADEHWWIDEPGGLGVSIAASNDRIKPPSSGWKALKPEYEPLPVVETADI
jgi:hypothetical protein